MCADFYEKHFKFKSIFLIFLGGRERVKYTLYIKKRIYRVITFYLFTL